MSVHKHPNAQWEQQITYDNVEFSLANGQTDYDIDSNQSDSWNNIAEAKYVSLRTDQTITVKINSATANAITVTSSDSPFKLIYDETGIVVINLFLTNASGSAANIKLFLA